MTRTAHNYAEAFVNTRREGGVGDDVLIANLLRTVDKHNDRRKLPVILGHIERLLIAERGASHFAVASAHPLSPKTRTAIESLRDTDDVMTFSTNAALVAGIRIAKNHEHELDYSFLRAVSRLFA